MTQQSKQRNIILSSRLEMSTLTLPLYLFTLLFLVAEVTTIEEGDVDGALGDGRELRLRSVAVMGYVMNIQVSSRCCEKCQTNYNDTSMFTFRKDKKYCWCYKTIEKRPVTFAGHSYSFTGVCGATLTTTSTAPMPVTTMTSKFTEAVTPMVLKVAEAPALSRVSRPNQGNPCSEPFGVAGYCRASLSRWSYDKKEAKCKEFIYGGCRGNANNFLSLSTCTETCGPDPVTTVTPKFTEAVTPMVLKVPEALALSRPNPGNPCSEPFGVVGYCRASLSRWSYDKKEGKCKEFIYGGCRGNANNFLSLSTCTETCGPDPGCGYHGIECCPKFTSGDTAEGREIFIQANQIGDSCQATCRAKYSDSTGVTESTVETYGNNGKKFKCWCEFEKPQRIVKDKRYRTCVFNKGY